MSDPFEFHAATVMECEARWSCGKPGELFRCEFCGHKFKVGDWFRAVMADQMRGVQEALRRARELEDVPIIHTKAMSEPFNQFQSYLKLVTFIEAEQRYVETRKIGNVPDRRYMEGKAAGLRYILMCVHDSFKHDHVRAENTDLCGACGYSRTHEVHYIEDVRGVKV